MTGFNYLLDKVLSNTKSVYTNWLMCSLSRLLDEPEQGPSHKDPPRSTDPWPELSQSIQELEAKIRFHQNPNCGYLGKQL